jgi:hypothetical protein
LNQIPDIKHDVITLFSPPEQPLQSLLQALQDLDILQFPVLVGLIAHLTGSTLQDEIDLATRRLQQLGLDVSCRIVLTCWSV